MKLCPNCHEVSREGVIYCEHCGAALNGANPIATRKMDAEPASPQDKKWGTAKFGITATLSFHLHDIEAPITVDLRGVIVIGRLDPATGDKPDLDLTDYGALEKGVSRKHARITRVDNTLLVTDLESANGTFINGTAIRLPTAITDGDEIRLGRLSLRVYFS